MEPQVDPPVAPPTPPPTDQEMHALVEALRKVEDACTNALAAGHFDETQMMLMKSVLQGSLNAKSTFALWVESVKKDLQFLAHFGDENTPDAPEDLKPPTHELE
jgi:hypothetical protein